MKTFIELIELIGGVALLFAIGWMFARISGYGKIYDKMMNNKAPYTDQKIKGDIKENKTENKTENFDDIIHHVVI